MASEYLGSCLLKSILHDPNTIYQSASDVALFQQKYTITIFDLIIAHTPISTQSSNSIVSASVAQLDAPSDWRPGVRGFNPRRGQQHSFMEIDQEIFSTVILSLPLIQEGQLSVSGERMCTILVNRLED